MNPSNRIARVAIASLCAAALGSSGAPACAKPAPSRAPALPFLSLVDAQRQAIAAHPDLRAAGFDQQAASEAVKIARSSYEPQAYGEAVQAVAPGGTRIGAYNALSDPTVIQRTAAGVGISQYISDFGRTADLVRASQYELAAKAAEDGATRDQIVLNVTQAYFEALRAEALLDVADETVNERNTLLGQIKTLQRAGLRSTLDVSIAQRDASQANQLVVSARNQRLQAFTTLGEALGTPDYRIYRLQNVTSIPKLPPTIDGFIAQALVSSPDLTAAKDSTAAANERAAAAARLTSPTITGYGFFGVSPWKESNVAVPSPYALAGVALTVPIFTGGALKAERRQASDAAAAAAERTLEERNLLYRDVRGAFDNVQSARETIGVTDQLLRTAREALRLTQTRYRLGLSSISDLSVAQLQEQQAAIARANATYDYAAQETSLRFAAGIIAGGDLAGANAMPKALPNPPPVPAPVH